MNVYETERFYIEEDDRIVTTFNIMVKKYNRRIYEGDYFNLDVAVDDVEFLEKTVEDVKSLFEFNPIYS